MLALRQALFSPKPKVQHHRPPPSPLPAERIDGLEQLLRSHETTRELRMKQYGRMNARSFGKAILVVNDMLQRSVPHIVSQSPELGYRNY